MKDLLETSYVNVDGFHSRPETLGEIAESMGPRLTDDDVVVFTGLDHDSTGQEPTLADHASKEHAETGGVILSEVVMRGVRPFSPYTPEPTPRDGTNN